MQCLMFLLGVRFPRFASLVCHKKPTDSGTDGTGSDEKLAPWSAAKQRTFCPESSKSDAFLFYFLCGSVSPCFIGFVTLT